MRKIVGQYGWTITTRAMRSYGIALLFYRPERRLSISVWLPHWSQNYRLWGPRLLSWQRKETN